MVGDGHGLESDTFCVLEERVRPPYFRQPLDGQQAIFGRHVVWQPEAVVFPALSKEHVTCVGLKGNLN